MMLKKSLLQFLLYLLLPCPILVFALYVTSLFIRNEFIEYWSTMMTLLVEGVGEAAPQLILQIFTILSDAERKLTPLHLLCLASSCIMVSKCSTELCESFGRHVQA